MNAWRRWLEPGSAIPQHDQVRRERATGFVGTRSFLMNQFPAVGIHPWRGMAKAIRRLQAGADNISIWLLS
jgi:hypothetical protein